MSYLEWKGVHKTFGDKPVLRGFDLAVTKGEVLFIIGTSGVGKSVAIKLLVGLLRIDAGEIWFDGERVDRLTERELPRLRRRVGMVFQSSTLFDSMTLAETVALPMRTHQGLSHAKAIDEARVRLGQVYMAEHADRYPAELSDGMRKRAAIARTLALGPDVVLFDEPTTGLDPVSARRVDHLIRELAATGGHAGRGLARSAVDLRRRRSRRAALPRGVVHVLATPAELDVSQDPIASSSSSGADLHGPDGDSQDSQRKVRTIGPISCYKRRHAHGGS